MESPTVQLLTKLEQQLHALVDRVNQLSVANQSLQKYLTEANKKLEKKHQSMRNWQEKYDALKAAQGINTADTTARKKALHHIDVLIREVDACITQLEIKE